MRKFLAILFILYTSSSMAFTCPSSKVINDTISKFGDKVITPNNPKFIIDGVALTFAGSMTLSASLFGEQKFQSVGIFHPQIDPKAIVLMCGYTSVSSKKPLGFVIAANTNKFAPGKGGWDRHNYGSYCYSSSSNQCQFDLAAMNQ